MTVLDAIAHVQQHDEPALAFRYSCRVGMCGTCAVVINGREGWACRTLIEDLPGRSVTVEPLRNLPVIKDLVVDMRPFFSALTRAAGFFVPGEDASTLPSAAERENIDPHIECITCGACYSACTMLQWDREYLGPAALNRVATLVMDSRDAATVPRLAAIDDEHGCWRCHSQFTCTEVCPMHLRPAESIGYLKRRIVEASIRTLFHPEARTVAPLSAAPAASGSPPSPTRGAGRPWRDALALRVAAAAIFSLALGAGYLVRVAGAGPDPSAFVVREGARQPEVLAGAALFRSKGCEGCHAVLGSGGRTAPDLWRVGGRRDEAWLRQLLQDPDSVIAPGSMPAYPLRSRELAALLAYLHDLDLSRYRPERLAAEVVRAGAASYLDE